MEGHPVSTGYIHGSVQPVLLGCRLQKTHYRSVSNITEVAQWGPNSWPTFDDNDIYLGPLQRCSCQAKYTLAKRSNQEEFRTTGTSVYPEAMDKALAAALAKDWLNDATFSSSVGDIKVASASKEVVKKGKEEGESVANHDSLVPEAACQSDRCCVEGMGGSGYGNGLAGFGPKMKAYHKGKWRSIHDGGGLGSPGRWPPKRRRPLREKEGRRVAAKVKTLFLKWVAGVERDKQGGTKALFWELAAGRHQQSPFTKDMEKYRKELDEELLDMGLKPKRRIEDRDTEIQFRRLMAMMEATGDEDWEFLEQMASEGVSLGVDEVMPRTHKVFEEKQKWAREFVDYLLEDQFSENYTSAEESHEDIKRQVKEEVDNGSILKLPEEEAKVRFKGRLAVAALGAVPKELGSDKVRLIHDGSYSVDINRGSRFWTGWDFRYVTMRQRCWQRSRRRYVKRKSPEHRCCMTSAVHTNWSPSWREIGDFRHLECQALRTDRYTSTKGVRSGWRRQHTIGRELLQEWFERFTDWLVANSVFTIFCLQTMGGWPVWASITGEARCSGSSWWSWWSSPCLGRKFVVAWRCSG